MNQCTKNPNMELACCLECLRYQSDCRPIYGQVKDPLLAAIYNKKLKDCEDSCVNCKNLKICSGLVLENLQVREIINSTEESGKKAEKAKARTVTHIVLTGGPCGGKSTAISKLEQHLTDRGYKVIIAEEVATQLINSGIAPWSVGNYAFQWGVLKAQLDRDKIFDEVLGTIEQSIVIIYDRGLLDGLAYIDRNSFNEILYKLNVSMADIRDKYDGVFNLVTAANGAPEFYTLENNKARSEGVTEAINLDNKLQDAWTGHQHLRIIPNVVAGKQIGFEEKIDSLIREVFTLMGIPVPLEIERKFLIEYPNIKELISKYKATKVDIIQTYLVSSEKSIERRVRQRGIEGSYSFYYTEKRDINSRIRNEVEEKISQSEYLSKLLEADTELHQIKKERYCLLHEGKYLELDIYPAWNDKAILEIELATEEESIVIPDDIKVIKEVTDDIRYRNGSLAKTFKV